MFKYLVFGMMLMCTFAFGSDETGFVYADLRQEMQPGDRLAVLVVHFGSTHDDTRAKTYNAVNAEIEAAFPQTTVREAYTSRIVIRRLGARGIFKSTPTEALNALAKAGYTHVIVQPTHLIEGVEMESVRSEVAAAAPRFKKIRVGNPLLYAPEDYESLARILGAKQLENKTCVWVGHGTYHPATSAYALLEYALKAVGYKHHYVGTIGSYPGYPQVKAQLQDSGAHEIVLVPLLFVAGEHAKNDIALVWRDSLERDGFSVQVQVVGLGEDPAIRARFVEHAQFAFTHEKVDIVVRKAALAKHNETCDK